MNPEELRIGNWIKYNNEIFWVQDISMFQGVYCSNLFKSIFDSFGIYFNKPIYLFEPVRLTVHILVELGFEYYEPLDHYKIVIDDVWYSVIIHKELGGFWFSFVKLNADETQQMPLKKVEYIHKLQNLFFALSEQELNRLQ